MNLRRKITLLAVCPVAAAVIVAVAVLVHQQRKLDGEIQNSIRNQALSEAGKVAHDVRLLCVDTAAQAQDRLFQNLGIAREAVLREGGASLDRANVEWKAVNQLSGAESLVELPRFLIGGRWLGKISDPAAKALIVDEVMRLTNNSCTIFQRMNETGDMIRVATTNLEKDKSGRAIGTYVPAKNSDGSDNAIVRRVLGGETYCGRAFVVDQWRTSIYEPIWDEQKKNVIGMLSIGYSMEAVYRRLRESIAQMTVGKTGYIFVLGADGPEKGRYIVSHKNERNGENIWDSQDSQGRFFIRAIVEKGLKATSGSSVEHEEYYWKNADDAEPRKKLVAIESYTPWNWVIGASVYEEDFSDIRGPMIQANREMLLWVTSASALVALIAAGLGYLVSRRLAGRLQTVATELDGSAAKAAEVSSEIAETSKAVADGAAEQASALEETSASLEEMSATTRLNAERASDVEGRAREARGGAERGAEHMRELKQAVEAIHGSSSEITKVIKTIDEIAFQTNILALNAAVEAARAGEAGAGFAVVAEEVRALAQRSAAAAHETALLINEASQRSERGLALTGEVAAQFGQILEQTRAVGSQIDEIAVASREQSTGIEQIKKAVQQLDGLTQSNAVHADKNAAVSRDLKDGTLALRDAIDRLGAIVDGRTGRGRAETA